MHYNGSPIYSLQTDDVKEKLFGLSKLVYTGRYKCGLDLSTQNSDYSFYSGYRR